jgi:DNA-binding transcriptional ArsR family regulator
MSPRPASATLRRNAPIFAALGDETRLYVVAQLCARGPLSITQVADGSDVTRQAVTKHLAILEEAGLVRSYRQGRERFWELEIDRLDDVRTTLDFISQRWDKALARLQESVERGD